MTKSEYLGAIRVRLLGLPEADIKKAIDFYEEAISDRMEDGLTEDQAIAELDTPQLAADKILMETPLPKLVKATSTAQAQARSQALTQSQMQTQGRSSGPMPDQSQSQGSAKKTVSPWIIVLLILGSPIWLPLGIAVAAVALAIVVTIFAVLLSVVVAVFAIGIGGIAAVLAALVALVLGKGVPALMQLAAALILIGISLLLFIPLKAGFLWFIELMARLGNSIKQYFINKRNTGI